MLRGFWLAALVFCGLAVVSACKKDAEDIECDGSTRTYDADIKAIVDANCTSSNCHGSGSSRGDYTSYAGLEADLNSGIFKKEVLTDQSMPRGGSLSTDELIKISCWADNGYPEN